MCVRIWSVILDCFILTIDMIMVFICLLSLLADRIQQPVFRTVHNYLKKRVGRLYMMLKHLPDAIRFSDEDRDFFGIQRGNAYAEDLLRAINLLSVSKPYDFEVIEFSCTTSTNVQVELSLYPSIRSCRYFKRSGDWWLGREHGRVRVKANVCGSILPVEATLQVRFLNFFKVFNISGSFRYIEVYAEFNFDQETLTDGELTEMIILDISVMNLRFVDAGRLNFILNFTVNNLAKIFKNYITAVLQKVIRTELAVSIVNFQFPVENLMLRTYKEPTSDELTPEKQERLSSNSPEGSPRAKEQATGPCTAESSHLSLTSEGLSSLSETSESTPMLPKENGSQTLSSRSDEEIA